MDAGLGPGHHCLFSPGTEQKIVSSPDQIYHAPHQSILPLPVSPQNESIPQSIPRFTVGLKIRVVLHVTIA